MREGIQRTYLFTKMVGAESEQDFKDLANEIVEYIREKEARIARLEQAINRFFMKYPAPAVEDYKAVYISSIVSELGRLLEEAPQQSIAHIQAEAVEKFIYKAAKEFPCGMSAGDLFGLFQQLKGSDR